MKAILIIDDEETTRSFLSKMITRKGFAALAAENGQAGLDLFKKHHPAAVFLDIMLPDIHGEQMFAHIRELDPSVRVYFISGSDHEISRLRARNIVADGYFSKPIFMDEVSGIIDALAAAPASDATAG